MTKKRAVSISGIVFVAVIVIGILVALGVSKAKQTEVPSPDDMIKRVEAALGDDYKKQSETVLAGTIKYSDKDGNEIKYHILKTTYFEADPSEVTGLNVNALGVLFPPDFANSCEEMLIKEWSAALYRFDGRSYLCWTDTPEVSYVLEYNPDVVPDEEIIKMAESAEVQE